MFGYYWPEFNLLKKKIKTIFLGIFKFDPKKSFNIAKKGFKI